jgi:hypothetical protein
MTPPDRRTGSPPPITRRRLAFLIAVPLAWGALLWFHPAVGPDTVYEDLRDQVSAYLLVHLGTLIFIGLMGVALYMLVRDLPGRAATICRLAIGPFVLFYAAWEAIIGLAIGVMVQHANGAPEGERPAVSAVIQAVGENAIVGDAGLLLVVGALSWITAIIAAAVAVRRASAPVLATLLLALSAIAVSHPPPIGPIGLACFAAAAGLLALSRRTSRLATTPAPTPTATIGAVRT